MICMGLITTLLVFDIANKAASIDESLKEKYTPEEEELLMAATLTGVFFTVFWPFAIAWPMALRHNAWSLGYLATGAVILAVSPFNYLAVGILAGLVWMFVFCYWVLNPHHMSPMVSWYFNSKARQARPVQLELPLSPEQAAP